MEVSRKTVYTWAKDIIGARPAEDKGDYRIQHSGLILFLADIADEEPPELTAEDGERMTEPHTEMTRSEHLPDDAHFYLASLADEDNYI
jgi:hypothetical protein